MNWVEVKKIVFRSFFFGIRIFELFAFGATGSYQIAFGLFNMEPFLVSIHASTHSISFSNDAIDDIFLHISFCLRKNLKYYFGWGLTVTLRAGDFSPKRSKIDFWGAKHSWISKILPSPNPFLMYITNVKDSENADRWLAALSSSIVH